ncbi:MAG: trigger factor [Lachnospiraceae bacterium]|nr:trigger factor [Robinsoniella sp.]MDY3765503.1 trigger factor [Lachnospiraceae bacterium]
MKKKCMAAAVVMACSLMLAGCSDGNKESTEKETVDQTQTEKETETETEEATEEKKEEAATSSDATAADATAADATAADATPADAQELKKPEYRALDYVQLGTYKGLEITVDPIEVTDEEVDSEISSAIVRAGKREELSEGTVENGDIAVIDFVGKKDDVAFDGGTAKDYELEIGSNTFISGFEEGVEGMKVGETKDLELTFPENYQSTELAGQDVIFTVTVNAIKRIPELSDDLVKELSSNSQTVEEYRAEVKEALTANKVSQQENTELQTIYSQIVQNSVVKDFPQDVIDYTVKIRKDYYTNIAEQYGMGLVDFVQGMYGMTEEQFDEQLGYLAQETVRQEMLLKAIAETENIEVSEEEYLEGLQAYTEMYGFESPEALLEVNSEETVREVLLQDKVMQFLLDNAVIKEATAADATIADAEK